MSKLLITLFDLAEWMSKEYKLVTTEFSDYAYFTDT